MARSSIRLGANSYAEAAVKEAERSSKNGTFGVGGLLVKNDGAICKRIGNGVIKDDRVYDPTAHVECQLVDWYFLNVKAMHLPAPCDMTIVTSLDPCIMCSGAILAAGFHVIHLSQDGEGGVSCKGPGDSSTLPGRLGQRFEQTFSAFGIIGKRPFVGPPDSIFSGEEVDSELNERSENAFSLSLLKAKKIVANHHELSVDEVVNPQTLAKAESPRIFRILKKYNPRVFSAEYTVSQDEFGLALGNILIHEARESFGKSGVFNSACLVDPFGNVLLAEHGQARNSPTGTPFMQLMRRYHGLLFEAGQEGRKYFAHVKFCRAVMLLGPSQDPHSLMEVGCFGAAVQGELPPGSQGQLQYVIPRQKRDGLEEMLGNLPPLYSQVIGVKDAIQQVENSSLKEFCASNARNYIS